MIPYFVYLLHLTGVVRAGGLKGIPKPDTILVKRFSNSVPPSENKPIQEGAADQRTRPTLSMILKAAESNTEFDERFP